jgi:glycosyltransferase involved in cell wall biosynthesis
MKNRDTSRINLMFIVPCFGFGGLEQVVINIVKELDRSRYNPSFCSLLAPVPEMFEKIKALDLPCYVLDKGEGFNCWLPFRIARLLRRNRIDLINGHDIGATLFAAFATRLAGIGKIVHTDHSQILTKHKFMPVYRWVLKQRVSCSITVSENLERFLISNFGLKRERVITIPNGIEVDRFAKGQDTSYLYREFGIDEKARIIGSIGRLTEQKGMRYLIEAFSKVNHDVPDTMLIIVGDGELRGDLEKLSETLSIRDNVIFTGIREDTPELLELFDIFVLPSLWEGQPLTIMEAMAAGKPIIATDVGGNSEILDSGKYGVIVPSGSPVALAGAVMGLLGDEDSAKKLGADAEDYCARELSSVSMVRKYERVYEAVLSGNMSLLDSIRDHA